MAKKAAKKKSEPKEEFEGGGFEGDAEEGAEGSLVVDLADVDENQQWPVMPRAIYPVVIKDLVYEYSSNNNPMWSVVLEVDGGEYDGQTLFFHMVFTDKALPRVKKTLSRIYPELLEKPFDPEQVAADSVLIGVRARARVDVIPYQGQKRNNVRELLAPESGEDFA